MAYRTNNIVARFEGHDFGDRLDVLSLARHRNIISIPLCCKINDSGVGVGKVGGAEIGRRSHLSQNAQGHLIKGRGESEFVAS